MAQRTTTITIAGANAMLRASSTPKESSWSRRVLRPSRSVATAPNGLSPPDRARRASSQGVAANATSPSTRAAASAS